MKLDFFHENSIIFLVLVRFCIFFCGCRRSWLVGRCSALDNCQALLTLAVQLHNKVDCEPDSNEHDSLIGVDIGEELLSEAELALDVVLMKFFLRSL